MKDLREILGANSFWGWLPWYFCLLVHSLLVSSEIVNVHIFGLEAISFKPGTFFLETKFLKMGFHDIWYPIFAALIMFFLSKIKKINLLVFFLLYFIIDYGHNTLYFYIMDEAITTENQLMAFYNAARLGLFVVLTTILHKKLHYYIIVIPVALLISLQVPFWMEFLAEIYIFKLIAVEWHAVYLIVFYSIVQNLVDGVIVALVYILFKSLFNYLNQSQYVAPSQKTQL